jgi:hypothetical protein
LVEQRLLGYDCDGRRVDVASDLPLSLIADS